MEKNLFAFAGIWDEYETEKGELEHTFLILTTGPNQIDRVTSMTGCL
jgi:putative SOS response-associated peptidase YedK